MLDRELRQVRAKVVPNVKRETLQNEILSRIAEISTAPGTWDLCTSPPPEPPSSGLRPPLGRAQASLFPVYDPRPIFAEAIPLSRLRAKSVVHLDWAL